MRSRVLRAGDLVALRGVAVPVRPLALLDAAVEAGAGGAALLRALRGDLDLVELQAVAEQAVEQGDRRSRCSPPRGPGHP